MIAHDPDDQRTAPDGDAQIGDSRLACNLIIPTDNAWVSSQPAVAAKDRVLDVLTDAGNHQAPS